MHAVSFANLICTFGEHKFLLDYADEIVLPAFLDEQLVRVYGESTYFFYQAGIVRLKRDSEAMLGIAGHFIKDTVLRRTQVFRPDGGLIHDEAEMASAPSAFFLLILANHKLIYVPETPYAPDLTSFAATVGYFLRVKHKAFLDDLYAAAQQLEEPLTRKQLLKLHPKPLLMIVPLASAASIDAFIERYDRLESVQFTLLKPNQEIDGQALWRGLRRLGRSANAQQTRIEHKNKEGLNKENTASQVHDAAAAGNQVVRLYGRDREGNVLRGNNDEFRLKVPVPDLPRDRDARAQRLFNLYNHLVDERVIRVDRQVGVAEDIVRRSIDEG